MRVLLVDDHALVRGGLRSLVAELPEVSEAAEVADDSDPVAAVAAAAPDVVLLELAMRRMDGMEALSRIVAAAPAARVIVLSIVHDEEVVRAALRAGASAYVAKSAPVEELHEALRATVRGEPYVSSRLRRARGGDARQRLTERQREVLELIADGLTTRAIAERLMIGMKTVESHRMHLMQRLGIHDVAGLVRYVVRKRTMQDRS